MAGGLLSLKWNNHQSTFLHVLSSLYLNDTLSDVTLACEGEFFSAHKLVLATCSEYFEKIFERIDGKHSVIVLKDIKSEELGSLLNYMYEGEVNVLQEKLSGLIKAAEHLKVKGLSESDESPDLSSSQFFKRGKRGGRTSSLKEPLVSPPPKRKRHGSDSSQVLYTGSENYSVCNVAQEENVVPTESKNPPDRVEDSIPHVDKELGDLITSKAIKDEPDIELKKEMEEFAELESQYTHVPPYISPVVSEMSLPSLSLQSDMDKETSVGAALTMDEASSSSNTIWNSGNMSTVGNSNRIDNLLKTYETQKSIRSNSEHLTITPDDFVPLLATESEDENRSGIFACPHCPFKTYQKNIHDNHIRRHLNESSEKTFLCQFCSYSCMTKSNLKCHVRRHTGEKPFSCPHCSYRSSQSSNIKIHVRRMHKNVHQQNQDGRNSAYM